MPDFKALLARAAAGSLSVAEARRAFDIMLSGDATPAQMGGLLMAMRARGETVDEIVGGVQSMRGRMTAIEAPPDAMDIVGTGGDATGTYNISTASALTVAACGVAIAKHGNRALSSKTGAADVLATLGVDIDADLAHVRAAAWEAGLCFMMAPRHHGAMRNVAGVRVELGTRTIFNLLGPMSNPANVKRQLIGVFARQWLRPMAETLKQLGSEKVWIVHGSDGADELTLSGPASVCALERGELREFEVTPEDAGLERAPLDAVRGGDPEKNAAALAALLDGERSAFRDTVLLNAAAALIVADKAKSLREGAALAAAAIDGGRAKAKLAQLVEISRRPKPEAE